MHCHMAADSAVFVGRKGKVQDMKGEEDLANCKVLCDHFG